MWGYPVFVLGAVCSFLEPFRGHLSPNIDVSQKLTLRYPHEGPWVGTRIARHHPASHGDFIRSRNKFYLRFACGMEPFWFQYVHLHDGFVTEIVQMDVLLR